MKAVLVWFLVSTSESYSGFVNFSPPLATLTDCEVAKDAAKRREQSSSVAHRCVRVNLMVPDNAPKWEIAK